MIDLEVDAITVMYGEVYGVRDVSLHVEAGEAVALIGSNGAGKTTVLKAIAGAVRVANGTVRLRGNVLTGKSPEAIAREGIALVPEGRRIFGSLSVAENLDLGLTVRRGDASAKDDLKRMLELFPVLEERYGDWAAGLSGGEQQQLALARALLSRPRVLLLDEPSLGLAPQVVDEVFRFLEDLRGQGQSMLLVEQNAVRAIDFAERIYALQRGHLVREATRAELQDKMTEVGEIYLGEKHGSEVEEIV